MDELRAQLRRQALGIWRRRWIAVAVAWMICIVGWVGVTRIPNSYESSARLYVDADEILTPLLRGLALDNSIGNQIEMLQRTLLSRPNVEKLISKTDLELNIKGPADLEQLVSALNNDIHILPQTRNLFTITYRNEQPQLAYDVVNTVLNIFVESKIGRNRSDMENAQLFIDQQIAAYERQLRDAETKRAEFRSKYIDLLPGDGGVSRLDAAREQVRALNGELADAIARRDRLTHELAVTPPTLVTETDPGAAVGGGDIATAERRLQELLGTDTEQHPDVVRQRRLIEQLRKSGTGRPVSSGRPARSVTQPNAVYAQLTVLQVQSDSDVASLNRRVADAIRERDRLAQIALGVPGIEAQSINLDRDYGIVRKNYDELVARREEMRLSAAADSNSAKAKLQVIDPPQVPHVPVGPKRVLLLSGVLLAGLGGGIAAAILLGQLDSSFHGLRELRTFGLPVAGGISLLERGSGRGRVAANTAAVMIAVLMLCGVYGGLLYRFVHLGLA